MQQALIEVRFTPTQAREFREAQPMPIVTNLAARLCGEAKPGQILISKRVLATTDRLLEVEAAAELTLKGFHRSIPAYNVLGLKA